jgi:transglutaminase-like putative cysteine protease
MLLSVRHETLYNYETPVIYSVQRLHLWPSEFAAQKTVSWSISAPGIETALSYVDGFGNRVHLVNFADVVGDVSIVAEGTVDCEDAAGVVKGLPSSAPDAVFTRQTDATIPNAAIRNMADKAASKDGELATLHAMMGAIHDRVDYELGSTHAHTTAAEAFADGRGVCQDHAHIFVGAARGLGIPARYVTGYLVTGQGATSTAAHAWAEALVPNLGWIGFDPVRGSRRGGDSERMSVEVRVEIAQQ